jgi:hypothetical protein
MQKIDTANRIMTKTVGSEFKNLITWNQDLMAAFTNRIETREARSLFTIALECKLLSKRHPIPSIHPCLMDPINKVLGNFNAFHSTTTPEYQTSKTTKASNSNQQHPHFYPSSKTHTADHE